MITGFEEYADHVQMPDDEHIVMDIVNGLKRRVGKNMAITNKAIRAAMKEKRGVTISDIKMRDIIHYIRVKGLVVNLLSSSKGYYVSNDPEEITKYRESMKQRIRSMQMVEASMKFYSDIRKTQNS